MAEPSANGFVDFVTESRAIECPDEESMKECARDLYSYDGIDYLYLNRCGKLRKGTRVISYADYEAHKAI